MGAKKELLIYDPKISDPRMIRLLEEQAREGVDVRILGKLDGSESLQARNLAKIRLHVRSIVRDRTHVFIGRQSLRASELETRREVGVLEHDSKIAGHIAKVFDQDWAAAGEKESIQQVPAVKAARKVAKAVAKSIPSMENVLEALVTESAGAGKAVEIDAAKLEEAVKIAVKQAVEQSVLAAVEEVGQVPAKA